MSAGWPPANVTKRIGLIALEQKGVKAISGAVCGFATSTLIAYWDVITGGPTIAFQWIIPTALVVQVTVGSLISAFSTKRTAG